MPQDAAAPPTLDDAARKCTVCGALNPAPLAPRSLEACIRCGSNLAEAERRAASLDPERLGPTPATHALLAVCGALFALEVVFALGAGRPFPLLGCDGRVALALGALDVAVGPRAPLRFVSAVFVHFGAVHLLANSLALRDIGGPLERLLGWARVVVVFVVTGSLGFVATWALAPLLDPARHVVTAGASGGVLGVAGALIGVLARRKDRRWVDFAARTILFGVVMGFALNASSAGIAINNTAHVVGLSVGLPLGYSLGVEDATPATQSAAMRAAGVGVAVVSAASLVMALA